MYYEAEPSPELIWDDSDEVGLEKETLLVSMFHINPMLTEEEIRDELQRVYKDLTVRFEPWVDHYIWNEGPVKFQLEQQNGLYYIYGELMFGDYFNDEWLVTQILFELSKTYEDLYIHLSDNEGEFLLIEGADNLPDWLEPKNARNRDWINHGRILIIPDEYYKDRGLKMTEALKFLDRAVYKCLKLEKLDELVKKKLKEFPTKALEGQVELEITVPRHIAGLLMKKNVLNQAVMAYGKEISSDGKDPVDANDTVDLKIRTTALAFLFLDYILKSQQLTSPKIDGGLLVTKALEAYVKDHQNIDTGYLPTDKELAEFNEQGDLLQNELIRLMRIDKRVKPNISFDGSLSNGNDSVGDEDMISRLENFFKDTNAGLDGVENVNVQQREPNSKIEELDPESDSEEDDDDAEAKKYLAQEKIDIDEDDFFEFFAKEALKLSDKDLEGFRNLNLDEKPSQDDDYEPDSEEEEFFKNFTSGDVGKSLQELLKSMETEGGLNGPAATLLQSMGMNNPNLEKSNH